jgi:hypothetical protein
MGVGLTKPMLFAQPFQRQSIDLVGPLTETKKGYKWILSIIDAFTNYVTFVPLPNKEAATVADAVYRRLICVHGAPEILLSDRGSEFTAGTFEKLMADYNIDHRVTSPYSPTTNGQCERAHRRLNAILKICVNLWSEEWDQCLEQAAFSYNVTPLTDFPYSPYYMLHLFHPKLPADLQCLRSTDPTTVSRYPTIGDYIGDKKAMQKAVHQSIQIAKLEEATKRKLKADTHQREVQYQPGDMVTVWRPVTSPGSTLSARSSKLLYKNIGPFKVVGPVVRPSVGSAPDEAPLTYRLLHVSTGKENTYSVRHMFPFMRGTKHSEVSEEQMEEWAPIIDDGDLGLVLRDVTEVAPGMVLWMKARAGQPGYLSVVKTVDARADLVGVQLFNTFADKRLRKWERVWYDDHPDHKKRQPRPVAKGDEWHEYRTPVTNKDSTHFKPWLEDAAFADFTPISLKLKPDSEGYVNLPTKFHNKYVLGLRPKSRPHLPNEEQRDLSWYVDTTVDGSKDSGPGPATHSLSEPLAPSSGAAGAGRARRSTRNPAPVHRLSGGKPDSEDLGGIFEDATRSVMIRWIHDLSPDLEHFGRLIGAKLFEFVTEVQDAASLSGGNCKGRGWAHSPSPDETAGSTGQPGRVDRRARRSARLQSNRK